ncbi:MAG: hypothetical protein AB8G96_07460 [Phycisphaerales bacterium]
MRSLSTTARLVLTAMLAAAASGLSGCTSFRDVFIDANQDLARAADGFAGRKQSDPVVIYDTTGPVEIDVDLFAGDVTVRVDPDLDGTEVRLTKRATFGRGRGDEALGSIESISATSRVVPGRFGQRLEVRATSAHPEDYQQRVNVTILTPGIDGLSIRTGRGRISARDAAGPIELFSGQGRIRLTTKEVLLDEVTIVTNSGDVDLRAAIGTAGVLDFEAVRGRVQHEVDEGRVIVRRGTGPGRLDATVGDRDTRFTLRAADGDVRFAVVERPNAVGRWIID